MSAPRELIIVVGVAGSGKTVALGALEDFGYFAVQNLPLDLLEQLLVSLEDDAQHHVTVSLDTRLAPNPEAYRATVKRLTEQGWTVRLLQLDAKDDTLVRRFSETRRRHPDSSATTTVEEAIRHERERLEGFGWKADRVDTSGLSGHALRAWLRDWCNIPGSAMTLVFESFGFKHGVPIDADIVFDARLLPNPHYETALAPQTGLDRPVVEFLVRHEEVHRFADDIAAFVERWIPSYAHDNRPALTVAIGCTGGRHRSVYLVERLAARFAPKHAVLRRHRQLV